MAHHQHAVLIVTDALALPASAVLWTLRTFEDKADSGKRVAIVTQAPSSGSLKVEPSSLDVVVSLAETAGFNSFSWLVELAKLLKPGGQIVVQEPQMTESQTKAELDRNLLLAGYINSEVCYTIAKDLNLILARDTALSCVTIKAQKPMWETGTSFSIKTKLPESRESSRENGRVIMLSAEQLQGDGLFNGSADLNLPVFLGEDDLIDEDSLLTEADLTRPEIPRVDDCEVGKAGRKACKNCTCGRADMEKQGGGMTVEQLNNPQSACGSCGLGDAFRCSSCPYRGLPPFKLGEKITLGGTLLTADV